MTTFKTATGKNYKGLTETVAVGKPVTYCGYYAAAWGEEASGEVTGTLAKLEMTKAGPVATVTTAEVEGGTLACHPRYLAPKAVEA